MSVWCRVAVSALACNERLVPCCSFSSCRQGVFGAVLQFQLVQARSVGVVLQFQFVQARSILVSPFMLVQTVSFGCHLLGSCGPEAFVGLSSDLGESFLTIFIAMSLD
ncbi:hypothetical protein TB1_034687 [Malus domestica]